MVVRMRHTKSHTANRRSHHALTAPKYVTDKETNVPHLRHRMCATTGVYKGRKILETAPVFGKKVSPKKAK